MAELNPCPICKAPVSIRRWGYFRQWAVVCEHCRLVLLEPTRRCSGLPALFDVLAKKWNAINQGEN